MTEVLSQPVHVLVQQLGGLRVPDGLGGRLLRLLKVTLQRRYSLSFEFVNFGFEIVVILLTGLVFRQLKGSKLKLKATAFLVNMIR